ncbi:hypothetical protein SBA2_750015 [Acidobacteriia bacterium SbA2]|nr:hypothetical protein SBA2_750015 [Acidobacteriia bacterium SbA2]
MSRLRLLQTQAHLSRGCDQHFSTEVMAGQTLEDLTIRRLPSGASGAGVRIVRRMKHLGLHA